MRRTVNIWDIEIGDIVELHDDSIFRIHKIKRPVIVSVNERGDMIYFLVHAIRRIVAHNRDVEGLTAGQAHLLYDVNETSFTHLLSGPSPDPLEVAIDAGDADADDDVLGGNRATST